MEDQGSRPCQPQGKTTRTRPERIQVKYVQIPWDFVQLQKYLMLVADVMFMNGLTSWSPSCKV